MGLLYRIYPVDGMNMMLQNKHKMIPAATGRQFRNMHFLFRFMNEMLDMIPCY